MIVLDYIVKKVIFHDCFRLCHEEKLCLIAALNYVITLFDFVNRRKDRRVILTERHKTTCKTEHV